MTDPGKPIETTEELADAAVRAFLDGDAETRQHIVDELGARTKPKDGSGADGLDWS